MQELERTFEATVMLSSAGVAGATCGALALRTIAARRRPRSRPLLAYVEGARAILGRRRGLWLMGCVLALLASPASAGGTSPPGRRHVRRTEAPWTGASGTAPPLPLAPAPRPAPPWERGRRSHPALHGRTGDRIDSALFPRARAHPAPGRRGRPVLVYPSPEHPGHGRSDRGLGTCRRRHRVAPGESLWSIAADVVGRHDPGRIARLWPRLYARNRRVIGSDPDLIRPGQVLELPRKC